MEIIMVKTKEKEMEKKVKLDLKKIQKTLLKMKEEFEKEADSTAELVKEHEDNTFADANDLATHDTDISNEMNVKKLKDSQYEDIVEALERIETEDFGVCEECGVDIGAKRLEVYPTTKLCISCQEEFEKTQKAKSMVANSNKTEQ
jgi:DnaK suppressor protein